ncbi:uncharacterized protein LOC122504370 isoform X2 [Leptopilina heterotoma]|uniref:uncharacterized protein LOC122504370 isoform X2 n=1 Tax=Leptopilina heterotoma TaxID=63436 RepID=UPI001CA7B6D1|nr:uncharacterized protein LOC122504370 isoform X2 [Leptopilina heterotoma]
MSSSIIVEPRDNATRKDDTLIIMVNDDGTISVDEETLQNLIMNQANANVSVVKLGQTEGDAENGDITFTVDPPRTTVASEITTTSTTTTTSSTEGAGLVDPFMEMDPEQLERLETALQSEEAKQILGENVTAMLDMLTVEERQNSLKHSIELDHCYTTRLSPSEPKVVDPLPITASPETIQKSHSVSTTPTAPSPAVSPASATAAGNLKTKSVTGRPRRSAAASFIGTPKTAGNAASRNANAFQDKSGHKTNDDDAEDDNSSLDMTESSESDSSDNDSDFGPRGPRRGGVRARGGRKGLTTRGGSISARRRGSNKRLDTEQVRRLDKEMAAAVDAMKSPEKEEKPEKVHVKTKKPRVMGGKKKDESITPIATPETSPIVHKPLQTTNQVKANLINANMIKGDMILTKPGEGRNQNQKIIFVQKQILMKSNEMKQLEVKKTSPLILPKTKVTQSPTSSKITTKDGKLVTIPILPKSIVHSTPGNQPKIVTLGQLHAQEPIQILQSSSVQQQQLQQQPQQQQSQQQQQLQQPQQSLIPNQKIQIFTSPIKVKCVEVKKEKKKSDNLQENLLKINEEMKIAEIGKSTDVKGTPEVAKKHHHHHQKKDNRKSPATLACALGPALFSTPDIIRRVSVGNETKSEANTPTTPVTSTSNSPVFNQSQSVTTTPTHLTPCSSTTPVKNTETMTIPKTSPVAVEAIGEKTVDEVNQLQTSMAMETEPDLNTTPMTKLNPSSLDEANLEESMEVNNDNNGVSEPAKETKSPDKVPLAEELQSSLDPVPPEGVSQRMEQPNVPNDIVPKQTGIEGEEQLLATLEMEATKHEDDLLAEALLLQEELGVDLASGLDQSADSEPLLSPSAFSSVLSPKQQTEVKVVATATVEPFKATQQLDQLKKKEDKEPIQIIRGGRVITLPPIEAPATRSKKLQAMGDKPQQKEIIVVKEEKKPSRSSLSEFIPKEDVDLDDEFEDEGDNSDSEDDPDRLWCICKRPHNNRFMICCDVCEDWFHGKCVNVSKAMGQQMEEQGVEWVCPNCAKKKAEETRVKHASPVVSKRKSTEALFQTLDGKSSGLPNKKLPATDGPSTEKIAQGSGITQCVVCKKEARNSSIYCSDTCILAHAQETCTKDKPATTPSPKAPKQDFLKGKVDARVMVYDRKTGKVLSGAGAPTAGNLKNWLKENPSYEIVRPNSLNTFKIAGKTVTAIQTQDSPKQLKVSPVRREKMQLHPKMVFAKVPGSKQTILAASAKKTVIVPPESMGTAIKIKVQQTQKIPILRQTILKTPLSSPSPASPVQKAQVTPKVIKRQEPKTPTQVKQQPIKSPITLAKKPETEPIRVNVRKTMTDALIARVKATDDLKLTQEEIKDLALNIELELYKHFKDTGTKYKAKYRSLIFNIKDPKNLTLFRKIADRSLTPDAVVRLSPEEMASQELAEWREKETKHQLDMIKKNELDLLAQAKSIVVKTHKGELVIENDRVSDPVDSKSSVNDIVTVLNNIDSTETKKKEDIVDLKKLKIEEKKDKEKHRSRDREKGKKRDRSKNRHRHSRDRERSKDRKSGKNKDKKEKDRDRERDKEKGRDRDKEKKHKKSKSKSHKSHKDYKEKEKKEEERKDIEKKEVTTTPPRVEPPIEDRLWRHIDDETTTGFVNLDVDSDLSDREPSSTVNIKTPDINDDFEREREPEPEVDLPRGPQQTVWRGFVSMPDVAKFFITAQEVSGNSRDLMEDLPDTVDVVGRIGPDTVWDYISKMKKNGSKEILVIRLTAANDEEKIPYITLYSYLNSRSRLGVVRNFSNSIKDFYIMPFPNLSKIPNVLLPLNGPGFEEQRPPLLLGIIVRNKCKRIASAPLPSLSTKILKKDPDRSYTPPLILPSPLDKNPSPPTSPRLHHKGITDSLPDSKLITQHTLESLNKAQIGMSRTLLDSATISKIVPELSSRIDLTAKTQEEDDDEPYSPGEMDEDLDNLNDDEDDDDDVAVVGADDGSKDNESELLSTNKDASELQRKMDELNRQIEEQKQQIQNISSSFLGDVTNTLPGLGLDPETNEGDDAYSPSDTRSFTPPPQGLKFTQPILDKVSDITIPPNLQEILANVKRQETSKIDPYLPSKPSASFLTSVNTSRSTGKSEKYSSFPKGTSSTRFSGEKSSESQSSPVKEIKTSTLSSMSELDLIKKAAEQLASETLPTTPPLVIPPTLYPTIVPPPTPVMPPPLPPPPPAATTVPMIPSLPAIPIVSTIPIVGTLPSIVPSPVSTLVTNQITMVPPPVTETPADNNDKTITYPALIGDALKTSLASNQPRPPGLEEDEVPSFLSPTGKAPESPSKSALPTKFIPKSGVVLSVKRKLNDNDLTPSKIPRTKSSRWGQPPPTE